MTTRSDPVHRIATAGDRAALCGAKNPERTVLTDWAQRHIDGWGMQPCPACKGDGRWADGE